MVVLGRKARLCRCHFHKIPTCTCLIITPCDMTVQALLGQVNTHLQEVRNDPSKGLNEKLLEQIDGQITGMWRLFSRLVLELSVS